MAEVAAGPAVSRVGAGVSVLTPSLNYADFIGDALVSVQGQTGLSLEHIVQDGRSTDGTVEVLRDFGPDVRWRSEPDEGQSDALNKALSRANHEWIALLNADEFYLPDGLEVLVKAGERSGADVMYGDCVFVDDEGRFLRLLAAHRFDRRTLRSYGCFIDTCATLVRRSVLSEGIWDVELRRIMDWDLFLRLAAERRRFHYVPYPVGAFRVHKRRVTARPGTDFPTEYTALRERHGAGSGHRTVGRLLHRAHKLVEGAFRREVRARSLAGLDLRWFRPEVGLDGWYAIVDRCYPAP
jgi:glycosyltransferase involved in cell wall biosynthesis